MELLGTLVALYLVGSFITYLTILSITHSDTDFSYKETLVFSSFWPLLLLYTLLYPLSGTFRRIQRERKLK